MKLTYKNQLILTCVIIIAFDILNSIFKNWIFTSVGFCVCGLLWIIHPVMIRNTTPTKTQVIIIRLAGVLLILMGIFTRSYFY